MAAPLSRLRRLLQTNLAELEHSLPSRPLRLALRNLRIIVHVGRALVLGKHNERAAALTYFSLLSLVPLLAVVFSLFKALGGVARIEAQAKAILFDYLVQEGQGQVSAWLDRFVSSFNAGAVGAFGMAVLMVTLILTLVSVEEALNRIWGTQLNRRWGMRLVVYWSLLTVGPVLLGTSLAITATLQSSEAVRWAATHVPLFGLLRKLVPTALTALALSALYVILPAARVRYSPALIGGLAAGVIFELAKWLYALYMARVVANHPLYGSLAALPFFFVWVNYSWRIVLFGADVAHAVQYVSTDPSEESDPRTNQATREEAAVRIAGEITAAFLANRPPLTTFELTAHLLLPAHLTETLCQHLLSSGLLREVAGGRARGGFVPARSPADLTVADIVRVLRHQVGVAHWSISRDANDRIEGLLSEVEREAMARYRAVTWSELTRRQDRDQEMTVP